MHGSPGGGKTFLVQLFFDSIHKNNLSHKVLRIHFQEFMNSVHEEILSFRKKNKKNPLNEVVQKISRRYKLICFDELEIIDIADAMLVSKIFKRLIEKKVAFIITSNYQPNDLYKDGLQRAQFKPFIDLIIKKMNVLEIKNSNDLRFSKKNKKLKNFFYPLNTNTKNHFENFFFKIGVNKNEKEETLISLGRHLTFKRCMSNAINVEFDYICSYKFSPNDYVKISNNYKWIFIDNIPLLDRNRLNKIRRFIILIDILYEKKNNVIIRAENNIINIFRIDKKKLPYSRTLSRIVEMSSDSWLEKTKGEKFV